MVYAVGSAGDPYLSFATLTKMSLIRAGCPHSVMARPDRAVALSIVLMPLA